MATGVALVMLMQAGFGALEVGAVRTKNTRSLMLKNVIDFSVGTILFWLVGYGVAFPGAGARGFALRGNVAEVAGEGAGVAGEGSFLHFALLLAYASTSTTIVSGALAERTRLSSYVVFAALAFPFLSGLPMRWTWSHEGWLNAAARDGDDGITVRTPGKWAQVASLLSEWCSGAWMPPPQGARNTTGQLIRPRVR